MEYKHLKITIKRPEKQSIALILWLSTSLFLAAARFVLTRIGVADGLFRDTILFTITCIPFIYLLIELICSRKKRLPKWALVFFCLFASVIFLFLFSLICNPSLEQFFFRKDYGIAPVFRPDGAIFAFLFFSMFDDPHQLRKALTKSAYVLFIFQVFVIFLPVMRRGYWIDIAPNGGEMHVRYSLSFGYDMLLILMIFLTEGMESHKLKHYALTLASAILIVTNGGRGAMVILALFISILIIANITDHKTSVIKKVLLIIGITIIGAGCFFFINDLLAALISILTKHNISSRSIEMIINGSFSASNGRDRIWNAAIEAIRNGGLFGYGMFGDRPFVSSIHVAGYSHNLFLELIVSFGIIGIGIIIFITVDAINMIFFCKDKDWRIIYIILFSCSCKLMLSFSFWYIWEFWAAAAVAYKYRTLKKRKYSLSMNNSKYKIYL